MAGIGQQYFPTRLDLVTQDRTQLIHRIPGMLHILQIDVIRCQVAAPLGDQTMARKENHHAVGFGSRRHQPLFQRLANVGERRLWTNQLLDVLGLNVAALFADDGPIHRLGIGLGVLQIIGIAQILVLRHTDHQSVAPADGHFVS